MGYTQIRTQQEDGILHIIIDRESKMNALNAVLLQEVKSAVKEANIDTNIVGIILTGSGDKAFAAGADIAEFANHSVREARVLSSDGHDVMNTIERSSKPIVAAVKGFALGGGCELAMACHFRVIGTSARFGQPEVNLGVVPGYGGTQRLVHLIGRTKALEYLCTGSMIKSDDALQLGLANYLVEDSQVLDKSRELLKKIASKSPQAIGLVIECVNANFEDGKNGYLTEIEAFSASFETKEFIEGTTAFLEKRKADFRK
jgi:enoyl-CoA hydratase